MVNALTIDVEEYFHPNAMDDAVDPSEWDALPPRVEHNTHRILDLLSERDVHATFFVLGWVAERWPGLVREIARRGHEVACHGFAHRLVYRLGPEQFRADVVRARRILEDCLGVPVAGFRAASYSVIASTLWALDVLIELGLEYDSSIFPVRHDIYGIPSFSRFPVRVQRPAGEILEIPASTLRLWGRNWPVAGGGYFRLLPYQVTRHAIDWLNRRERVPAMVYLHPWELDPEQPRLRAGARTRFRHYTNLGATERRLRALLAEFRFAPIREAFAAHLRAPDTGAALSHARR
ncbi:MAG TPA: XrtA system polysaccharide deacetylase [Candidatus Acidoferrales bacterium]|nr:XrtA system polysaccharide deacetylase [Candidatus Acidoferrales bacterium]